MVGDINLEILELLISAGADVNPHDYSDPPLVSAVCGGSMEAVHLMLKAGADMNHGSQNSRMGPPLIAGMQYRNVEVVRTLISVGADVNATDRVYRKSVLGWAMEGGNQEVIELVKAAGAR